MHARKISSQLLVVIFSSTSLHAIAQGIRFETGDWASVKAKALSAGKLVYVDFFTPTCVPCKKMDQSIFPLREVGETYNKTFVNYRIDAQQGEGLKLARQYAVDAYPSHVYIDPSDGHTVFRAKGAPGSAADFIKQAATAMEEAKAPKSWENFTEEFNSGKRDTAFLKAYLDKAEKLGKNNDPILNAYVAAVANRKYSPAELDFLLSKTRTLDNKAVAVLWSYRDVLDKMHADQPDYTLGRLKTWLYPTMDKAIVTDKESLLGLIAEAEKKYMPNEQRGEIYWYRNRYFRLTGQKARADEAARAEADFLISRRVPWYFHKDALDTARVKRDMRAIYLLLGTKEKDMDAKMQKGLAKNPSRLHPYSAIAALWLNDLASYIYEQESRDKSAVALALGWSSSAVALCEPSADLLPEFMDTHAHLLYISGRRDDAMEEEDRAITIAKSVPESSSLVHNLEAEKQKMKLGLLQRAN